MNMDYSAYEGYEIDGKVDTVLSRGTVIVSGDTYHGRAGHGQFLRRGLSDYLL
jgi:dihydropyrimidinase